MTQKLSTADLLFIQAQILAGSKPPIGTDPFSLLGLRGVDGTFNNISHVLRTDQYGDEINTDHYANVGRPFIYFTDPEFRTFDNGPITGPFTNPGPANYAQSLNPASMVVDASPRHISNLVADMDSVDTTGHLNPYVPLEAFGNPGSEAVFATPFNSLMTIFGQFFDHGLDFINKGGNGTILIPVLPGDPLYDPESPTNFMPLTRASVTPFLTNPDLVPSSFPIPPNMLGVNINSTAALVDQSQTYGSHDAVTFFLREYDANGIATGRLLTGADGGMATWADLKANAARLSAELNLVDTDALNIFIPVLERTDLPWAKGSNDWVRSTPALVGPPPQAAQPEQKSGQAIVADIAHGATPHATTPYDVALFNSHYVSGDGRTNENVALTAIHAVFHDEHNRLVEEIKGLIAQQDQIQPGFALQWNGEQLFQAAKLANEMQYQHMVFEEFARRISPNIDAFSIYDVTLNPNITSEFANAVYRLGHSMLTDTIDTVDAGGNLGSMGLVSAFLQPGVFAEIGAADINKGMSRQMGNEIDEFVVDSVRNMLLGLPLDLAAINIARGRDVGLPTLNSVRQDLYAQTNGQLQDLKPYASWDEFGANLLHSTSIVNFIAAYARDEAAEGDLGGQIKAARDAGNYVSARELALEASQNDAFMGTTGNMGFWDIDLWIGGLAEAKVLDGGISPGMLGSTFDFIFAQQMLALQNGDRLYYLARIGENLLNQIEQQTFVDLISRGSGATHINGDTFGTADVYVELGDLVNINLPNPLNVNYTKNGATAALLVHEVIGGTHGANTINAGNGNDTIWGEGGNDVLEGGLGKDHIYGGDGIDVITDVGGDDFLRGDAGDDVIQAGVGLDLVFGGTGNDNLNGGQGDDVVLGGDDHDTIFGGDGIDELQGEHGDDRLDGGLGDDLLDGGEGNDVILGGAGLDFIVAGLGNDYVIGGGGADTMDGGLGGYDIISYETMFPNSGNPLNPPTLNGITIDMNGLASTGDAQGDVLLNFEEVRGTLRNDTIIGDGVDNVLVGDAGNDNLNGGAGDDTLIGGEGNNFLVGGLGIDTAIFDGPSEDYQWNQTSVTRIAVNGVALITPVQVASLSEMEVVEFSNESFNIATGLNLPLISIRDALPWEITDAVGPTYSPVPVVVAPIALADDTSLQPFGVNGIRVGTIDVSQDTGPAGVRTFAVALTDDGALFRVITGPTGLPELRFVGAGPLSRVNYEAKPEYFVTVTVTDNNGTTAIGVMVKVTDVNDNRAVITSSDSINVRENTGTNVVVYRAESSDLDTVGPAHTYTLDTLPGTDFSKFTFVGGELRFITRPNFESPADVNGDGIYNVRVLASDGGGTTFKDLSIKITDIGESLENAVNDFNGDGKSDILWRNTDPVPNLIHQYQMNGAAITDAAQVGVVAPNVDYLGSGDFNGDDKADTLWYNTATGHVLMQYMDGFTVSGGGGVAVISPASQWSVVDTRGDFDGDGHSDILWREAVTGEVNAWLMNGTAIQSSGAIAYVPDANWGIEGTGDFDGDGRSDILWYNNNTGEVHMYFMNGTAIAGSGPVSVVPSSSGWSIVGIGDFDGDAKSDILWYNDHGPSTGDLFLYRMDGTTIQGIGSGFIGNVPTSLGWSVSDVGDYNGDGKSDILWRNSLTDGVVQYQMDGTTVTNAQWVVGSVGFQWEILV